MKMKGKSTSYSLLLTLHIITRQVLADFEQRCAAEEYHERRGMVNVCGPHLTDFVFTMCGGFPYLGDMLYNDDYDYDYKRKRSVDEIFLTENDANSYLRNKRSNNRMNQGIVCECCLNRCNPTELGQYCMYKKKKRSLRSMIAGTKDKNSGSNLVSEADVDQLYNKIEVESKTISTPFVMSEKEYEKMLILEQNKEENIKSKQASESADKMPVLTSSSDEIETILALGVKNVETVSDSTTTATPHRRRHRHNKRGKKVR